jgi:exodeoxyribonuclease VII small subunit
LEPELSFETALEQLERIVDDLERGEPELSAALLKYEQGIRLLAHCHGHIDRAERTVALLSGVDDEGNPIAVPFDATATAEREPTADPLVVGPAPISLSRKAAADDGRDDDVPF